MTRQTLTQNTREKGRWRVSFLGGGDKNTSSKRKKLEEEEDQGISSYLVLYAIRSMDMDANKAEGERQAPNRKIQGYSSKALPSSGCRGRTMNDERVQKRAGVGHLRREVSLTTCVINEVQLLVLP
jgi:hypothetical protein